MKREIRKINRVAKTILALLLCAMVFWQALPAMPAALAEGKTSKVTVVAKGMPGYGADEPDIVIELYKIGTVDENDVTKVAMISSLPAEANIVNVTEASQVDKVIAWYEANIDSLAKFEQKITLDKATGQGSADLPYGLYYGRKASGPSEFGLEPFFVYSRGDVEFNPKWSFVTSATVEKVWIDGDNRDGVRGKSVVVKLYYWTDKEEDAKPYNGVQLTLSDDNEWKGEVSDLPKYIDDKVAHYEFREDPQNHYKVPRIVSNYTDETNTWDTKVVNPYEVQRTTASVVKTWDDNNDQDGERPKTLTVYLKGKTDDKEDAVNLEIELTETTAVLKSGGFVIKDDCYNAETDTTT